MLSCGVMACPESWETEFRAARSCWELRSSVKVRHNENQETQRNRLAGSGLAGSLGSLGPGPPPTPLPPPDCGQVRAGWAGADTGQGTRGVRGAGLPGAHADLETLGSD